MSPLKPIAYTCAAAALAAIGLTQGQRIGGSGHPATESRTVSDFHTIQFGSAWDATIEVGPSKGVEITLDDNLSKHVVTEVKEGRLTIRFEKGISVNTKSPMKLRITTPSLDGISVSGASNAQVAGVKANHFKAGLSGSAHLTVKGLAATLEVSQSGASEIAWRDLNLKEAKITQSGASKADIGGRVDQLSVVQSGAASLKGPDSKVASTRSSGAAHTFVNVEESLTAFTSGAASVVYGGNPNVTKKQSGASTIRKK